ncbi:MAG TPA: TetR/AcrR family transcriptional regulator [Streptosporangiaceae bacterium]|nr:TetR/AcrR family transcriptional regulator [Streptosporangiaceae bacterium]
MAASQAPTGLARRGRRLSDQETERRMLRAAADMVGGAGMTVGLDHISLEDVIRAADVSRSTVYRRWPHKDLFFSDLVKELARTATPTILAEEVALVREVFAERTDWLDSTALRQGLVAELLRRLSLLDFQTLSGSAEWRTYVALHATFMSLADDELRAQVQAALAESEREHLGRVARAWEQLAGLLGYRLRPELGTTFGDLAALLNATMRGLVIMAQSVPELGQQRAAARPLTLPATAEWSLPALGLASIAWAFIEPDPDVEWDQDRIASVRQTLATLAQPAAGGHGL